MTFHLFLFLCCWKLAGRLLPEPSPTDKSRAAGQTAFEPQDSPVVVAAAVAPAELAAAVELVVLVVPAALAAVVELVVLAVVGCSSTFLGALTRDL